MKSLVIVVILLAALYFFFAKKNASQPQPATATTQMANPAQSPQGQGSNVLKRPLDRTREVLGDVRKNQESNQF